MLDAVDKAEMYADAVCSFQEMMEAGDRARTSVQTRKNEVTTDDFFAVPPGINVAQMVASRFGKSSVHSILADIIDPYKDDYGRLNRPKTNATCCAVLRDVFGNPFRQVTIEPAWQAPKVSAVAHAMYADRNFADMPILASALEDAGCASTEILDHCRSGTVHVRGCWVLDLVLDKL